jgi:hypothetical protein
LESFRRLLSFNPPPVTTPHVPPSTKADLSASATVCIGSATKPLTWQFNILRAPTTGPLGPAYSSTSIPAPSTACTCTTTTTTNRRPAPCSVIVCKQSEPPATAATWEACYCNGCGDWEHRGGLRTIFSALCSFSVLDQYKLSCSIMPSRPTTRVFMERTHGLAQRLRPIIHYQQHL